MSNMSPAPGTPQTNTKAIVAGIAAGVIAGLSALIPAFNDDSPKGDSISAGEATTAVLAFVVGSGVAGVATQRTQNKAL